MTEEDDTSVTAYLEELGAQGEPRLTTVSALYDRVRAIVPEAVEGRSYNMPALLLRGKGMFSALTTAKHIGVYPFSSTVVAAVRDELAEAGIPTTKGAIQLPNDVPLSERLLERIVRARLAEIDAR